MQNLTELEQELLNRLTEKYPVLKSHISCLQVSERTLDKDGLYVQFSYLSTDVEPENSELNALFSNGERIDIKGLKKGLGYVIDITNGRIESLNLMTDGDQWNGEIKDFRIVTETN